jgi:hypothetical protein
MDLSIVLRAMMVCQNTCNLVQSKGEIGPQDLHRDSYLVSFNVHSSKMPLQNSIQILVLYILTYIDLDTYQF